MTIWNQVQKDQKRGKIFSYTHFTFIILRNIHNWCVDVHILNGEKELSLLKKLESGYEKVDVKIINTLENVVIHNRWGSLKKMRIEMNFSGWKWIWISRWEIVITLEKFSHSQSVS